MGRLFWKIFACIWLAQLTASFAVGTWFWWEHEQQHQRWEAYLLVHPELKDAFPPPHLQHRRPADVPPDLLPFRPKPPGPGFHVPPVVLSTAFLASFLFAGLLAWYFSKPIRRLNQALSKAAEGELSERPGEAMGARRDELADLGRAFDQMAIRLHALMEGQRRLLGDVSHELRSPLARVQAAIGLARQQPALFGVTLDRLERESGQMDSLIGELLTLSRLDAGVGQIVEEVDLGELLDSVVENAQFEGSEKSIRVVLHACPEVILRGDGQLLHRAVENVVRNAIKYSPADTEVHVRTEIEAGSCCLEIFDQGPGVPEDQLTAIFQPFIRCAQSAQATEGYGLGLAIAQAVVHNMGGKITAHNRDQRIGSGLCVRIELPLARGDV